MNFRARAPARSSATRSSAILREMLEARADEQVDRERRGREMARACDRAGLQRRSAYHARDAAHRGSRARFARAGGAGGAYRRASRTRYRAGGAGRSSHRRRFAEARREQQRALAHAAALVCEIRRALHSACFPGRSRVWAARCSAARRRAAIRFVAEAADPRTRQYSRELAMCWWSPIIRSHVDFALINSCARRDGQALSSCWPRRTTFSTPRLRRFVVSNLTHADSIRSRARATRIARRCAG